MQPRQAPSTPAAAATVMLENNPGFLSLAKLRFGAAVALLKNPESLVVLL
jgi:hypothetical protein